MKGQGLALGRERGREAACKGGGRKLVGKLHPSDLIRRRAVLCSSSLSRFTFPSRRSFVPSATSASGHVSVHSLRGKFSPLGNEGRTKTVRPTATVRRPRVVFLLERNDPPDGRKRSGKLQLLFSSPLLSSFRRRSHHCSALEISADNHV